MILSKCKPIDLSKTNSVNINSPFHNGHKYEPLSIMHYEFDFNTTVGEFGCIKHRKYPFLRASDGINIDKKIKGMEDLLDKNPTTKTFRYQKRVLDSNVTPNGVWDLDECDFLKHYLKNMKTKKHFITMDNLLQEEKIIKERAIW